MVYFLMCLESSTGLWYTQYIEIPVHKIKMPKTQGSVSHYCFYPFFFLLKKQKLCHSNSLNLVSFCYIDKEIPCATGFAFQASSPHYCSTHTLNLHSGLAATCLVAQPYVLGS